MYSQISTSIFYHITNQYAIINKLFLLTKVLILSVAFQIKRIYNDKRAAWDGYFLQPNKGR